jgi:hypothetical protein
MTRYTRYSKNKNKNKRNYTVKYKPQLMKGGDNSDIIYYDFYNVKYDTTEDTKNNKMIIDSIDGFFPKESQTEETCDYNESIDDNNITGGEPTLQVNQPYPEKKNVVDIKTYKYEKLTDVPRFTPISLFNYKKFQIKSYRYNIQKNISSN